MASDRKVFGDYLAVILNAYCPNWSSGPESFEGSGKQEGCSLPLSSATLQRYAYDEKASIPEANFLKLLSALRKVITSEEAEELRSLYSNYKESKGKKNTLLGKALLAYERLGMRIREYLTREKKIFGIVFTGAVILIVTFTVVVIINQKSYITKNSEWSPVEVVFNDNNIPMVLVPKGCFTMGYSLGEANESPETRICIEEEFWIGKTEVTQGQYGTFPDAACNLNQVSQNTTVNGIGPDYPMNCVTHEEALSFCHNLGMRLPTEAEWEYVVRGPDGLLFPWGNDASPYKAIVRISSDPVSPRPMLPVASMEYDVTFVGAYDMAGSLREFTSTIYSLDGPTGESFQYPYLFDERENSVNHGSFSINYGTTRVTRGGNFDLEIDQARATYRYDEYYDFRFNHYGFRCAMDHSQNSVGALYR